VSLRLDVLLEQEPREEPKRELALASGIEVDVDGVEDLLWWDENVYTWLIASVATGKEN
jgi:hypothetical protein